MLADGCWPASFEMLSWIIDPQLPHLSTMTSGQMCSCSRTRRRRVASSPRRATRDCHRAGTRGAAAQPSQAPTLACGSTPTTPPRRTCFLLRSPRVYRVAVVRPQKRTPSASQRAGRAHAGRPRSRARSRTRAACTPARRSASPPASCARSRLSTHSSSRVSSSEYAGAHAHTIRSGSSPTLKTLWRAPGGISAQSPGSISAPRRRSAADRGPR